MDYDKLIAKKCKDMKPSGIRKFFDIAAQMDNVISLSVGEPDFQTPWNVRQAAVTALEKGKTKYTANAGIVELREAISRNIHKNTGVDYDPKSEIIVTVGGSEGIDISIRALINPGDEVLIVEPCFVCYGPIVSLCGGVPVSVQTTEETEFRLTPEMLREKITDRTKLLILPFPNNPTGAVMERKDLEAIAEVIRGTDILILSDEIQLPYIRRKALLHYPDRRHEGAHYFRKRFLQGICYDRLETWLCGRPSAHYQADAENTSVRHNEQPHYLPVCGYRGS